MKESNQEPKGRMVIPFGLNNRMEEVPVESFDEEEIGPRNHVGGKLSLWDESAGGISQSAIDGATSQRPVEDSLDLDDWPNSA